MKTIAIDIDDVLSVSAKSFVAYSNKQWGTKLKEVDFTEDLGAMWGVNHDEVVRRLKVFFASDIVKDFTPIKGAEPALRTLAKEYRLMAVTSRVEQLMPATKDWIGRHFENIPLEIYSAGIWDKLEKGAHTLTKSDMCVKLGVDYLIDDQLKHCVAVSERNIKTILFGNYAWNQAGMLPTGVQRARDWQAVLEYFIHVRG